MAESLANQDELNHFLRDWGEQLIIDNIFHRNPLLMGLRERQETYPGGLHIRELLKSHNDPHGLSGRAIGPRDGFNFNEVRTHTAIQFRPRYYVQTIPIWEADLADNGTADVQYWNYILQKKAAYLEIMQERFAKHLYSKAGPNSLQIHGLPDIFDNYQEFGGLDRTKDENAWWRTFVNRNNTARGISTAMIAEMAGDTSDGEMEPDLITTTVRGWNAVQSVIEPQQRYVNTNMGDFRFKNIAFQGTIPIIYDKYCNKDSDTRHPYYFINFNHLRWRPHAMYNMKMIDYARMPNNLGIYALVLWFGQVTSNSLRRLGMIGDINPTSYTGRLLS